ncbi:MAG: hypothetical protein SOV62_07270 [Alloprevotella sp.]|nr:hypothetical protein [Alloprevotella sp.]
MRKFTKFFMLLFALVGATVGYAQSIAESPTPISGLTSGYYVIKNVNPGNKPANYNNYIYCENTENGALKLTATAPSEGVTNPATIDKYLWYVDVKPTGAGENVTVTISSVFQTGYWPVAQTGDKSLVVTNNPQVFDLKTTNQTLNGNTSAMTVDGNTCLIGNTTSYNDRWGNPQTYSYFHVNVGNNIGSWHDANPQSLLYAQFYAATGIAKKLTLNCTDSKLNNTFTKVATFVSYSPLSPADLLDFYTIQSVKNASEETVNEITESGTYTVNCTSHFPFELMTFTNGEFANANFYTMEIANGSRDVVYEDGTGVTTLPNTKGFNRKSLWAFEQVSGTEANFKIYNFAAGATAPMAVNGTGNNTAVDMGTYDSGDASTNQFTLTTSDTGYAFLHTKATTYLNASVSLVDTNADADSNPDPNTGLGLWNANGDGSRFTFASVNDMTAAATDLVGEGDPLYPTSEGYIKVTDASDILWLSNYNKSEKTLENLNTVLGRVSPSFNYSDPYRLNFNPSKVYQIISYNDANCKGWTIYSNTWCGPDGGNDPCDVYGRKIQIGDERPIAETFVWFEAVDYGYRIHHANTDYRFVELSAFNDGQTPDMPVGTNTGGVYYITPAKGLANVFALSNYNTKNKWLNCGTGDGNTIVRAQAPADNDGDLWLIKEVSVIPVEIGAAKWSTLCLPVAVEVPDDANLKVYTVSGVDNAGVMTLNEVPAGTIVAKKTGLLLASTSENASDTYNFTVSTEAGTSYNNNNILMGTTARRIGFNIGSVTDPTAVTIPHYALAQNQKDGVVAFYPSTLNILPANKAYIKKADITTTTGEGTSRALYMTGETTGVNNALIQNGEAEEYYDLNGRRVLYPTTGIYATRSGKKVFIK